MSFEVESHPRFEVAAGTVSGRSHALAERANQDAVVLRAGAQGVIAIVADGCGGAERSEVGAWIGAHALATELGRAAGRDLDDPAFWQRARARVLGALRGTAMAMGGELPEMVRRFFLFTLVGAAIVGERAAVFGLGDGLFAVNGEVTRLGPFPGNAPPYLGHALLGDHYLETQLVVHRSFAAADLDSVLVATDGAADWGEVSGHCLPGSDERVGPLSALWRDDRFFDHPDALRRKLARMNRALVRPAWDERRLLKEPGLLEDDTTIVVVRARKVVANPVA